MSAASFTFGPCDADAATSLLFQRVADGPCPACGHDCGKNATAWKSAWKPIDAHSLPCVALKAPHGSWRSTAGELGILHIGINGGDGKVVSFSHRGIAAEDSGWENAACVALATLVDTTSLLDELTQCAANWQASQCYDAQRNNCLDFVTDVLNTISLSGRSDWTKVEIADRALLRLVDAAVMHEKAITLLADFSGRLAHKSSSGFSCRVFNIGAGLDKNIDKENCPLCFDWRSWQQSHVALRFATNAFGETTADEDWDPSQDQQWM